MSLSSQGLLVVIAGPTAVGKTKLSIELAKRYSTVILSADSRQFFKELTIGTAPPNEYELNSIPHYFIHHLSIQTYSNVSFYEKEACLLLDDLFKQHKIIFLVGGSGLYINAVCHGIDDMPDYDQEIRNYLLEQVEKNGIPWLRMMLQKLDPETYAIIDLKNKNRLFRAVEVCIQTGKPYSSFLKRTKKQRSFKILKIVLNINREDLYNKINSRVDKMMQQGLLEEAKSLFEFRHLLPLKTIGYKELFDYLEERISLEEAIDLIKRNTRKYARKQLTWFRRDKEYHWFSPYQKGEIIKLINSFLDETIVF